MRLLWIVTGAVFVVAVTAWVRASRTAKRLEDLRQMYWELRCQHGELRMQMQRPTEQVDELPASSGQPSGTVIPLASLKR